MRNQSSAVGQIRNSCKRNGFTLIEVVVSLFLSGLVVLMGVQVYQLVGQMSLSVETALSDWSRTQFLRDQVKNIRFDFERTVGASVFNNDSFVFITQNSVRAGKQGTPVLVRYQLEGNSLIYEEMQLPPWWEEESAGFLNAGLSGRRSLEAVLEQTRGPQIWRDKLLTNIRGAEFSYYARREDQTARASGFEEIWREEDIIPQVIRLAYEELGQEKSIVIALPQTRRKTYERIQSNPQPATQENEALNEE